mgnify:FL=1
MPDTKMAAKREKAYAMLINLIEDYNVRLLSTKVYWEDIKERENYKKYIYGIDNAKVK